MQRFLILCGILSLWLLASSAALAGPAPELSVRQVARLAEKAARQVARQLGTNLADYNRTTPAYESDGKTPRWSVSYSWHVKEFVRNGVRMVRYRADSGFAIYVNDKTKTAKAVFPGE